MSKINPYMSSTEIEKAIFGDASVSELVAMPLDIAYALVSDDFRHIDSNLRDWAFSVVSNDLD